MGGGSGASVAKFVQTLAVRILFVPLGASCFVPWGWYCIPLYYNPANLHIQADGESRLTRGSTNVWVVGCWLWEVLAGEGVLAGRGAG